MSAITKIYNDRADRIAKENRALKEGYDTLKEIQSDFENINEGYQKADVPISIVITQAPVEDAAPTLKGYAQGTWKMNFSISASPTFAGTVYRQNTDIQPGFDIRYETRQNQGLQRRDTELVTPPYMATALERLLCTIESLSKTQISDAQTLVINETLATAMPPKQRMPKK